MSIQKITEDNIEYFTIETNPKRTYSTSPARDASGNKIYFTGSQGNLEELLNPTGSVYLYANNSPVEKETFMLGATSRIGFQDDSLEGLRKSIVAVTASNKQNLLQGYLGAVLATSASFRKRKKQEILRFTPSVNFSSNTIRKNLVVNHLMPFYRNVSPTLNFAYHNYHSLNFFSGLTTSGVPSQYQIPVSSALIYPNSISSSVQIASGVYESPYGFRPSSSFSFDFWIKPNYVDNEGTAYRPGTVLHLTGAYAVSLLSGSQKDENGRVNRFKLMLQLGHSGTNLPPEQAVASNTTGVFVSDDNILEINKWQHVTIRVGGANYNHNSGSFIIDEQEKGRFAFTNAGFGIYSGSLSGPYNPSILTIGNFYQGSTSAFFFNSDTSQRDGLIKLTDSTDEPSNYHLGNPLRAEIHDIKIYNKYLNSDDIKLLQTNAPTSLENLKLYIPPFFTCESPTRTFVGTHGGVLVTPFQEKDGTTQEPFSYEMAFSVNGLYPNLENYVRDLITENYPRLWNLTGSNETPPNTTIQTANDFLYVSGVHVGSNKKRLYTILPCDHGNWNPNFTFISETSGAVNGRFTNDLGSYIPGLINLRNFFTGSLTSTTILVSGSEAILNEVLGARPGNITEDIGSTLTLLHRLRDSSSPHVVFFDISNLFYGNQLKPGSITITDPILSGSDKRFGMKIKDDGNGNLYRADASGSHSTWNSIGNVFYNEGILMIKHPNLFFFGQEGFDIEFNGIQNIHTTTVNAYAKAMQLISSSNPGYEVLDYDDELMNEPDQKFVYITGVNIHDENLNVVARANLAQPLMKRSGQKYLFKIRLDF